MGINNKNSYYFYLYNGDLKQENIEGEFFLKFIYKNFFGKILRLILKRCFIAKIYAKIQNSSWSKRKILPFIKKHNIDINLFLLRPEEYKSFNDFFIRKLKPGIRYIDSDTRSLISPADSKLFVIKNISSDSTFFVKNKKFRLKNFLGNEYLADTYKNGLLMIFRLAPYDYHRYHFPINCVPTNYIIINGCYESVNPIAYMSDIQPLQENLRHLITLKSEKTQDFLVIPVGAMFVGSIIETYQSDKFYKKGEEMGFFQFGGSTIVLLFKQNSIEVDPVFIKNSASGFETEIKMGQFIAHV